MCKYVRTYVLMYLHCYLQLNEPVTAVNLMAIADQMEYAAGELVCKLTVCVVFDSVTLHCIIGLSTVLQ